MPLAFDFTSTLVMGVTFPVATTLLARPLLHLRQLGGSILVPQASREHADRNQQDDPQPNTAIDQTVLRRILLIISVSVQTASNGR